MNKYFTLLLFTIPFSCLSPDEISISEDAEAVKLDLLLKSSTNQQVDYLIKKEVTLDGAQESETISFDTLILKKDLKSLREYSFARLIRATNYNKTEIENGWLYERKAKEKNGPVAVRLIQSDDFISSIEVRFENENLLYQSIKKMELTFDRGRLSKYQISGSSKLIGMESSSYGIDVDIIVKP